MVDEVVGLSGSIIYPHPHWGSECADYTYFHFYFELGHMTFSGQHCLYDLFLSVGC